MNVYDLVDIILWNRYTGVMSHNGTLRNGAGIGKGKRWMVDHTPPRVVDLFESFFSDQLLPRYPIEACQKMAPSRRIWTRWAPASECNAPYLAYISSAATYV